MVLPSETEDSYTCEWFYVHLEFINWNEFGDLGIGFYPSV